MSLGRNRTYARAGPSLYPRRGTIPDGEVRGGDGRPLSRGNIVRGRVPRTITPGEPYTFVGVVVDMYVDHHDREVIDITRGEKTREGTIDAGTATLLPESVYRSQAKIQDLQLRVEEMLRS